MKILFGLAFAAALLGAPAAHAQLAGYDKAQLQRGFLVYQSECASCHSANYLHYRDLAGLGFTSDEVAGIATAIKMPDGAPATADNVFKAPILPPGGFGGALPPDLSNIVAERPGGAAYIDALLTGYAAAPSNVTVLPSHFFNPAFPGGQIAMPPPLKGNDVAYADGTKPTLEQEAADVSAFLAWAADPNLAVRHQIGLRALIFFVFLVVIAIAAKRKAWREI